MLGSSETKSFYPNKSHFTGDLSPPFDIEPGWKVCSVLLDTQPRGYCRQRECRRSSQACCISSAHPPPPSACSGLLPCCQPSCAFRMAELMERTPQPHTTLPDTKIIEEIEYAARCHARSQINSFSNKLHNQNPNQSGARRSRTE